MNALYGVADQWLRTLWALSWQITVLVGLVWVASLLCRRASANFRYLLWCIVLVRLCLPMNLALPLGIGDDVRQAAEGYARSLLPAPDMGAAQLARPQAGQPESRPMPLNVKIALAWMLVSTATAALILLRSFQVRRLLKTCPRITRPELLTFLEQLRIGCAIRRPLEALCFPASFATRGPAVIGILRPTIVLPLRMAEHWSIKELEPVLLHELAHIKRWDLLVNLIQVVVQVAYFFHPLVWFANWRIRRIREEACDDLAVWHMRTERKRYGRSFLRVIEEARQEPAWSFCQMGMAEPKSSLGRRIVRIMSKEYTSHRRLGRGGNPRPSRHLSRDGLCCQRELSRGDFRSEGGAAKGSFQASREPV